MPEHSSIGLPTEPAYLRNEQYQVDTSETPLLCELHPALEPTGSDNPPFRVVQQIDSSSNKYIHRAITPTELLHIYMSQPSAEAPLLPPDYRIS